MFEVKLDVREFEKMTARMGAAYDQMPFAMSRALNDSVKDARQVLVEETWPQHVTVRNTGFIGWALHTEFSTKDHLVAAVYDRSENRGHLKLHAEGGVRQPRGARLAIPTVNVSQGAHGVTPSQRPANLARKVVINNRIYQQRGRGKGKSLVLMYVLAKSAQQPADVPFQAAFDRAVRDSAAKHFPQRMMEAMKTRR